MRELVLGKDPVRRLQLLACLAVFGFLYLPMIVIAVLSVNDNVVGALPLKGFTFRWYAEALADTAVIDAIRNSVVVAIAAVGIATVLGVPGAMLVDRYDFPGKGILRRFVLLPLILPGVITGVSFLTSSPCSGSSSRSRR